MKSLFLIFTVAAALSLSAAEEAIDPERKANTILLDETGVKNLRIELVEASEQTFETTVFAIGRIEEIPSMHSVLSSRIPGRIVEINAFEGDVVEAGQVLARVESRQPGDPPPTIDLLAPRAGLVIASHVRLGEPVEPDRELLDISDRSTMWAIARVPENDAPGIALGTKARIRIPALGTESILATLTRFGTRADRTAGTVDAIFEVENPAGKLQPGMRAEFSLITATREGVLAVPRSAVQGSPAKRVVYVKDFELPNAFLRSAVVLGEQNEKFVEVLSGIFPGDEVVTQGSYSLGFAGNSSGMSLKEALDAAHGHEHNEDGSEKTPEQIAADEAEKEKALGPTADEDTRSALRLVQAYAVGVTLALIVVTQLLWRARRKPEQPSAPAA